jgi:hypothetical protein
MLSLGTEMPLGNPGLLLAKEKRIGISLAKGTKPGHLVPESERKYGWRACTDGNLLLLRHKAAQLFFHILGKILPGILGGGKPRRIGMPPPGSKMRGLLFEKIHRISSRRKAYGPPDALSHGSPQHHGNRPDSPPRLTPLQASENREKPASPPAEEEESLQKSWQREFGVAG